MAAWISFETLSSFREFISFRSSNLYTVVYGSNSSQLWNIKDPDRWDDHDTAMRAHASCFNSPTTGD
jgi:hypothetical protein